MKSSPDPDASGTAVQSRRRLQFYINGKLQTVPDPDPRVLLVDYLRSQEVGLTGTKKSCAQGGCGACTVMLSRYDAATKTVQHESINSCLRPICSLDGMMVTTVEGIGSVDTAVDPVQNTLATCNGSQCGWCTPGWVMNMKSYLTANEGKYITMQEIEDIFDGNLCRCTGYRPILYAMKHFASDYGKMNQDGIMQTVVDPSTQPAVQEKKIVFPEALKRALPATAYARLGYKWQRPTSMRALLEILSQPMSPKERKLVIGNTSYGIYNPYPLDAPDYYNPHQFVDINAIKELHYWQVSGAGIEVGAATTYSAFLDRVIDLRKAATGGKRQALDALWYMAKRTAGTIVRNAASLGGNTMLVANHISEGSPFPSDLFTALVALGAQVKVVTAPSEVPQTMPILDFAQRWDSDATFAGTSLLMGYVIPYLPDGSVARTYKVAIRSENAHSIVNGGIVFQLDAAGVITQASVVFAGLAAIATHCPQTEAKLTGNPLTNATLQSALAVLKDEVWTILNQSRARMAGLPNEGFSDNYKVHLAESFLYKHYVYALECTNPASVPTDVYSAGTQYERPMSNGTQRYESYPSEYPVNEPVIKMEAFLQTTGEAIYNQDIEMSARGLDAAWVNSEKAYAFFNYQIPGEGNCELEALQAHLADKYDGFVDFVTAADVNPKVLDQGMASDDPIFAKDEVTAYGQSIGLILAKDPILAQEIAYYVGTACIHYDTTGKDPLLTIEEAVKANSIFKDNPPTATWYTHIWKITRQNSNLDWAKVPVNVAPRDRVVSHNANVGGVECLVIKGTQEAGGQIHFYMGPQAVLAIPGENHEMLMLPDSQSPDDIVSAVRNTLSLSANQVDVRIKRVAGAYGGKTTRSPMVAAPVAVAAAKHNRPVKLMMRRENDTAMIGHRHPTRSVYQIAVDTATKKIMGLKIDWLFNGGNTYDCSFIVLDCLQLRSSSGYYIPNYQSSGDVAQTQISSNTAFRAFGMLQGTLGLEDAIEAAAWEMGVRPEDIREANLYQYGQTTPYGQRLDYYYLPDVWNYAKSQVDFDARLQAVNDFNSKNRWTKRGISLVPIMYGAGYNGTFLEQGGALIEVYSQDGTVIVRHGGVEMGQGINTIVAQVTAEALNIPLDIVQIGENDTQVVPNPVSTGASTGSAFNAGAAREAGRILRKRLEDYCYHLLKVNGPEWCTDNGVDFWNQPNGWQTPVGNSTMWATIVSKANGDRVNLSEQVRFRQRGGSGVDSGLSFHEGVTNPEVVNEFVGFTFNVACSEVEVDVLTGETTILRSDIIYDVGQSLNPALDIGQVEGAFIQGVGYMLTEELVYETEGDNKGRLNTLNTWRYKIPSHNCIPLQMNVTLFPRSAANVDSDPNLLLGSKETGEPPLVLANTVYFAVKHAVLSARSDHGMTGWFRMDAPLTPQQVREHCKIEIKDLNV